MALTTTTLNGAISANDTLVRVTSGTGFAKGSYLRIDDEMLLQTADAASSATTMIPVMRGVNGTAAKSHVTTANVTVGVGSDFTGDAVATASSYPLAGRQRRVQHYAAAGAITLPAPGTDMVAIIVGTSALAMTVAAPTKDMDGCVLTIFGNAKSASTIQFDGTVGLGNAGASYDIITLQNAGNVGVQVMAINGFWNIAAAPAITGTTTAIGVAIA
jgi:hypothetical protein